MTRESNERQGMTEGESRYITEYISHLAADIEELTRKLDLATRANVEAGRAQERQIARMRLDRQLRRIPGAVWKKVKRHIAANRNVMSTEKEVVEDGKRPPTRSSGIGSALLVLAHSYPVSEESYGGQPVARRVPFYTEAGHEVVVFVPSRDGSTSEATDRHGTRVLHAPLDEFAAVANEVGVGQLAVHSPTPEVWKVTERVSQDVPTHIWIHGFEARDWRLLSFDFTAKEIAEKGKILDNVNIERQKTLGNIFARSDIDVIFVSRYMMEIAEDFAGMKAINSHVIHNVIDPIRFPYIQKDAPDRMRIASVRTFDKRNYGTDLMSLAIMELSKQKWFSELSIRIIGDGKHHEEDTRPLTSYSNVSIEKGFVGEEALREVLVESGIALLPTRWDSQGMMMGEAMASGLVPVTNSVAAIPEFADTSSAKLAEAENYEQLAEGIVELVENPDQFLEMSYDAQERVRAQCGPHVTVERELELFAEARV